MLGLSGWSIQGCWLRRVAAEDAVILPGFVRSELYIERILAWGEGTCASHGVGSAPWEVATAHNMRVHSPRCSEKSVLVSRSNNIPHFTIVLVLIKFVLRRW